MDKSAIINISKDVNTKITDRLSLKNVRLAKNAHFENKIRYSKNEIISGGNWDEIN